MLQTTGLSGGRGVGGGYSLLLAQTVTQGLTPAERGSCCGSCAYKYLANNDKFSP